MVSIIGFVTGALLGAFVAKRRGGNLPDMLQYGAAYGIALALAGILAAVIAQRMGWI